MYPDLSFEFPHPEVIASSILNEFAKKVNDELFDATAYLEPEEQDTIPIGSVVRYKKDTRRNRLRKRLLKAQELFAKDLENLYKRNVGTIAGLLVQLQDMSTSFTAERMDKHDQLKEWVKKQQYYYEYYHIKNAKKFSAGKDLDWEYVGNSNSLPETSGIYFLFHDGNVVYAGHSGNLNKRMQTHNVVRKYYLKNDDSGYNIDCVYAELPVAEAQSIERNLIAVAKPSDNRMGK